MKLSHFFFLVLFASATTSCTHMVYRASLADTKNYVFTSIDSVFLTDLDELVIYLTSKRGEKPEEHHQLVYKDNVRERLAHKNRYYERIVYRTDYEGEKAKPLTISYLPNNFVFGSPFRWYKEKVDSIINANPDGYFIVFKRESESTSNIFFREYAFTVKYGFEEDSTSAMNKEIFMRTEKTLSRPYYLALMPGAAALDAAGIATLTGVAVVGSVVVGIPILLYNGVRMLVDKNY